MKIFNYKLQLLTFHFEFLTKKILNTFFFWRTFSKKKKLYFEAAMGAILVVLIPLVLSSLQKPEKASAALFEEGWLYRQTVNITTGTSQTDYQASFTLNTSALITAGKMISNCNDIRITDINGKLLSHWIETGTNACNTTTTEIWTKVSSIPTSGATVYIYYGNLSAPNVESGTKVFEFFDDFGDGSISSSWTQHAGTGTITETGGVLRLTCTACDWWGGTTESGTYVHTPRPSSGNYTFEARISAFDNPDWTQAGLTEVTDDNDASFWGPYDNSSVDQISLEGVNADSGVSYGTTGINIANTINTGKLTAKVIRDSSTTYLLNDTSAGSYATWANESKIGLVLKDWNSGATSTADFDYFYIRKYAATEPTVADPANEEQSPGPVGYWKFDEGQGQTLHDSTSSNLPSFLGLNSGSDVDDPTWITEDQCISGKCLSFDSTGLNPEFVTITNGYGKTLSGKENFTIEVWAKPTRLVNVEYDFFIDDGTNILTYVDSTGIITFQVGLNLIQTPAGTLSTGKWYHLAFVKTGTTTALIYVDGVQKASGTVDSTPTNSSDNLFISSSVGAFDGYIDEPKIYGYTRTAAQVLTDYNARGSVKGASALLGSNNETIKQLSNGLVGFWKQDEATWSGTADEVIDSSAPGNRDPLTAYGAVNAKAYPTTGKFGNGGYLDGVDDYLATTLVATLKPTRITLALWWKPQSTGAYQYIIDTNSDNGTYGYNIQVNPGLTGYYVTFGSVAQDQYTAYTFTAGTWYHIAATYDGFNIVTYINGSKQSSFTITGSPNITYSGGGFNIGRNNNNSLFTKGVLDDIRLYNRALSSAEVTSLYNWAPGPVGYWNFEEKTGSSTYDTSGGGNTGTITNAAWNTGKFGSGVAFDGNGDFVNVPQTSTLDTPTGTISMWAYFNNLTSSEYLWSHNTDEWSIYYNGSQIKGYYNAGTAVISYTPTFSANQWVHLSFTFTPGGTCYLFVNGTQSASGTCSSTVPTLSNIRIGSISSSGSYSFNGKVDDVRVYNYQRTQKQVVEDMNAGHPAVGSPVGSALLHYKFEEGTGTVANNSGSQGDALQGTLTGMASPATPVSGWQQAGKFGKALAFDGTNDYASVSNVSGLSTGNSAHTISAWIKVNALPPNRAWIALLGNEGSGSHHWLINSAGVAQFGVWGGGQCAPTLSVGAWKYIVMSFDGTTLRGYENGIRTCSTSATFNLAGIPFTLAQIHNSENYFKGTIDEAKIYNYALTDDEVKLEYNRGSSMVLGAMSDTSGLTGGSSASNSASAEFCVPGDTSACSAPIAQWDFEEKTGTSAFDRSGNGYTATLTNGPQWITGKVGTAVNLDGTNDYIDPTAINGFGTFVGSSYTVSLWFNTGNSSTRQSIIGDWDASGNNESFSIETGGWLQDSTHITTHNKTGGSINYLDSNVVYSPNTWYHVEVTNNASTTTRRIYINGILKNNDSNTALNAGSKLGLGQAGAAATIPFKGLIDQVRIYNYARTPAQVALDYNRGGPTAWWKFDECQGTTLGDSSFTATLSAELKIISGGTQTSAGTCTTSSTAWGNGVSGKRNYSLNFDGTDDFVQTNYAFPGTNFSYAFWAKSTATGVYNRPFGAADCSAGLNGTGVIWGYDSSSKIDVLFRQGANNSTNDLSLTPPTNPTSGSWHHVVVTLDSSAGTKVYWDGLYLGGNASTTSITTGNYLAKIGADIGCSFFNGQIDDVRIYNYALTAAQVRDIYNNGAVNFAPAAGAP